MARIEEKRMHFLGKRGTDMKDLPVASHAQKTDLLHGIVIGLIAGSLTGALAGLYAYMNPDFVGMQIQPFLIFIFIVIGAAVGAWISGPLIGSSTPNVHLEDYQKSMQEGHILLILDIPTKRANDVRKIIKDHYPDAEDHGIETPAFP